MELAWTVTAIVALASGVTTCLLHGLLGQEKASCTEAWKQLGDMRERRDALVEENRELQRRLETIEAALPRAADL
jgi:hypothetical protein